MTQFILDWNVFFHALTFIFLASLPGRTTFLMIFMAAQAKGTRVLIGAGAAFAVQCTISVAIGGLLSVIPASVLHILVGLLFIYFGYHFWRESRRPEAMTQGQSQITIRNVFSVVFAGEWGDVSQVSIASYSAEHSNKVTVFMAALCALWLTVGVAVCIGKILRRSLQPRYMQLFAAIGFVGAGVYMLLIPLFNR